MKTFEERYTAWIDGQLTGSALAAFEQELARRAEAGDADAARTDKAAALQLRGLLKEHLQAPALTNTEFFSHQMREHIDAEIAKAAARRESSARPAFRFPAFAWPFIRFAGAGLLGLFVAGALYYGMVPSRQQAAPSVAVHLTAPQQTPAELAAASPTVPQPQVADPTRSADGTKLVLLSTPTPTPIDLNNDDLTVQPVAPGNGGNDLATSLHVGNANVLWLNNPPTLPNVPAASPSPAPAAPTGSAAPSATP